MPEPIKTREVCANVYRSEVLKEIYMYIYI